MSNIGFQFGTIKVPLLIRGRIPELNQICMWIVPVISLGKSIRKSGLVPLRATNHNKHLFSGKNRCILKPKKVICSLLWDSQSRQSNSSIKRYSFFDPAIWPWLVKFSVCHRDDQHFQSSTFSWHLLLKRRWKTFASRLTSPCLTLFCM